MKKEVFKVLRCKCGKQSYEANPLPIAHDELVKTPEEQGVEYTEFSAFDPGSGFFTSSTFKDLALSAAVLLGIITIGMAICGQ